MAVFCTDAFSGIAEAAAAMEGMPEFRYVAVPHPVADLSEAELMDVSSQFIGDVMNIIFSDANE